MGGGRSSTPPKPTVKYTCGFCSHSTDSESNLRDHKKSHQCSHCNEHFSNLTAHQDVCHAVMIQCTVCSTRISRGRMAAHIETHRCSNCHQLVEHSEERCPMVWCQAHQRRQPCADCEKVPCPICQVKQANQAACDAHQEERHRCPKCEGLFPNAAEHQQQECAKRDVTCGICSQVTAFEDSAAHAEGHRCNNCKELAAHPEDRCHMVYCEEHSCLKPCVPCDYPKPEWLDLSQKGFNVVMAGLSNVGKSSLINHLCKAAAKVGHGQTTMEATRYTLDVSSGYVEEFLKSADSIHGPCIRENLKRANVWDLPGHGTPEFPPSRYISAMGLRYFDYVVLAISGTVMEVDVNLVNMLRNLTPPVKCLVVQAKVDIPLTQALDLLPDDATHEQIESAALECMEGLREQTAKNLGCDVPIYLVSNPEEIGRRNFFKNEIKRMIETSPFLDKLLLDIIEARAGHRLHQSWEGPLRKIEEPRRQLLIRQLHSLHAD
ncbi:unnamed protein product [Effrenium voratum]|uniref:Uncharacterized protein n=1 Tax=Effrenium voratum TaxID=2562239 RepID=A0AA36I9E4_9DINO|nr:unnamed protein product [Effrenium voratum]